MALMTALTLLRWLKRTGVALRLTYAHGAWRLGINYPNGTAVVFAGRSLSHHMHMLAREMRREERRAS
jgi:hypothetical protein